MSEDYNMVSVILGILTYSGVLFGGTSGGPNGYVNLDPNSFIARGDQTIDPRSYMPAGGVTLVPGITPEYGLRPGR